MARGKKPARIASTKVPSRKRMLGEQEVFPIRCVSRREGMKYDVMGGYIREGRDTSRLSLTRMEFPYHFEISENW